METAAVNGKVPSRMVFHCTLRRNLNGQRDNSSHAVRGRPRGKTNVVILGGLGAGYSCIIPLAVRGRPGGKYNSSRTVRWQDIAV